MSNRVCKEEQVKLIMECRQSGLSDYQWCEQNGIYGVCAIVYEQICSEPPGHSVYLFCGKRCDRIKILFHEPDGYVLLYKKLDVIRERFPTLR